MINLKKKNLKKKKSKQTKLDKFLALKNGLNKKMLESVEEPHRQKDQHQRKKKYMNIIKSK